MKNYIAYDIETTILPDFSLPDPLLFRELRSQIFGVGVIYNSEKDTYKAYREEQAQEFISDILKANYVIGYNQKRFDQIVLNGYASKLKRSELEAKPQLDILEDFYDRVNKTFRVSLDNIASTTLGLKIVGKGGEMLQLLKEGKFKEVEEHCLQDVKLTKKVYEYGLKHKKIFYNDKYTGGKRAMEVEWE